MDAPRIGQLIKKLTTQKTQNIKKSSISSILSIMIIIIIIIIIINEYWNKTCRYDALPKYESYEVVLCNESGPDASK